MKQYYQGANFIPQEILLPCDMDEIAIVQSWLRQKKGKKVEISVPLRGDKKKLVDMATENAAHALEQIKAEMRAKLGNTERALQELAEALGLAGAAAADRMLRYLQHAGRESGRLDGRLRKRADEQAGVSPLQDQARGRQAQRLRQHERGRHCAA